MVAACNKYWTDSLTMLCLSLTNNMPIRSVYPPENGLMDSCLVNLNKTFNEPSLKSA